MKLSLNRSWLILLVALAVGSLATFAVNRYIKRQMVELAARDKDRPSVRVLVPKQDLPKGAVLQAGVVAVRQVPADWRHSNAITPEQFDRVENQRLAHPALRGEMLLWSLLEGQGAPSFSSRLVVGRRAITVPVDEVNSISGMLEPGDRIDLMASVRKDTQSVMFPLLQDVLVLATGSYAGVQADGEEGRRTYTTITLEASPAEAQRVLAAREVGKVAALLRPPGDHARFSSARRDAMSLLGIGDSAEVSGRRSIPVLYGGPGALKDAAGLQPLVGLTAPADPDDSPAVSNARTHNPPSEPK